MSTLNLGSRIQTEGNSVTMQKSEKLAFEIDLTEAMHGKIIVDGYHLRSGYHRCHKEWPSAAKVGKVIASISSEISSWLHNNTQHSLFSTQTSYCDAILSVPDEVKIKKWQKEKEIERNSLFKELDCKNISTDRRTELLQALPLTTLEFDIERYIQARTIFLKESSNEFEIEKILNLEIKDGDWIRLPPRQTNVDTQIATEMMACLNDGFPCHFIVLVSNDGGFSYTMKKMRECEFNGLILNVKFGQSNREYGYYSTALRDEADKSFYFDTNNSLTEVSKKPS
ncbi:hypothetical protein AA103196_1079 [Ameyamaea chiangmaiensis NBRC 103196]|uniref:NYN domain-containing protein n=1 Tax=Ameyamaea chiangmaiensis TaxID=442969 RepID=A0A850P473_9PROT|nr:NYN domain-containing protein [Ameyamaea chiangmaiensis]MBS4076320.1 NYN domain-containing protein [Ameyamaea chiangmaiensis]NVN39447.1 NYN domain-containing protein [Ameyamaea chiangmaiensis]GBQ65217.1 hypothetical protein AA103196_1079 [Ameyamaea chiangmaiensis NBRC 103196]